MPKILLVDDAAETQAILQLQLAGLQMKDVTVVANGQDALKALDDRDDIEVIICDWHMSPVDGLELCVALKKTPRFQQRQIPIILMTGDHRAADLDDRTNALQPGLDLGIVAI